MYGNHNNYLEVWRQSVHSAFRVDQLVVNIKSVKIGHSLTAKILFNTVILKPFNYMRWTLLVNALVRGFKSSKNAYIHALAK